MRKHLILFLMLAWLPLFAQADMVVVTSTNNDSPALSRREIINIFMGRYRFFANGQYARPLDLPSSDKNKHVFYQALTGKEQADINSYWARLILTGAALPPEEVGSEEIMLEKVAKDTHAIGYINRSRVDKRFRIIFDPNH